MVSTGSWSGNRRAFPAKLRTRILKRDPVCRCTGCTHHDGRCTKPSTVADHIIPVAEGGTDTLANGQGLCASCHDAKTRAEIKRGLARRPKRRRASEKHPGLR